MEALTMIIHLDDILYKTDIRHISYLFCDRVTSPIYQILTDLEIEVKF